MIDGGDAIQALDTQSRYGVRPGEGLKSDIKLQRNRRGDVANLMPSCSPFFVTMRHRSWDRSPNVGHCTGLGYEAVVSGVAGVVVAAVVAAVTVVRRGGRRATGQEHDCYRLHTASVFVGRWLRHQRSASPRVQFPRSNSRRLRSSWCPLR